MAELRLDPVTRRWVVVGRRPVMADMLDIDAGCAFCPGNERMTPPPIREVRDGTGAWTVRVFHDRAPIFRVEGGQDRRAEGMFDRMNPIGAHEVIVETAQHGMTLAQLPREQVAQIIEVTRDRILDLKRDRRFRYVSLFKNQRPPSPSLQGHSYSQIVASPVLPQVMEMELRWSRSHFLRKDRCLFCDIIQQEVTEDKRVVDRDGEFVALCPFASHSPYEIWVLPLEHSSSFENYVSESTRILSLASFLKISLQRIERISNSLHAVVHTEPNLEAHKPTKDWWRTVAEDFHWHIEIHPDVEGQRRYLGSEGFYFNPIPAEEAAVVLRALEPVSGPPGSV
jgi:UDPglucose--hexose-1-phosphate uridylyltransferase